MFCAYNISWRGTPADNSQREIVKFETVLAQKLKIPNERLDFAFEIPICRVGAVVK
jgi:hypothetical protein